MSARKVASFVGAAVAVTALQSGLVGVAPASAAPCPDVEVVFARGTTELPGVGGIGQAFVDSLRSQVDGKSVSVYAVNYPASTDFPTASLGVIDASAHVTSMAATCPDTKLVLGGFSQGAAVISYVTLDAIPEGYTPPPGITGPMDPEVADNVAAVALFGKPTNGWLNRMVVGAPPIAIGPAYAPKTIDLCAPGDPVCSDGNDNFAHNSYGMNGMVGEAANYAARRL